MQGYQHAVYHYSAHAISAFAQQPCIGKRRRRRRRGDILTTISPFMRECAVLVHPETCGIDTVVWHYTSLLLSGKMPLFGKILLYSPALCHALAWPWHATLACPGSGMALAIWHCLAKAPLNTRRHVATHRDRAWLVRDPKP